MCVSTYTIQYTLQDQAVTIYVQGRAAGRVYLLQAGDVAGDVLHGDRVLHRQLVALALHPCPVDDYPCIGGKAYRTAEHHHVATVRNRSHEQTAKVPKPVIYKAAVANQWSMGHWWSMTREK